MKGALTKKHISEQAKKINLPLLVKIHAQRNDTNTHHLSQIMAANGNFLHRNLKKKDHHISLLIALSIHLQTNLLETYFQLLPENLRPTRREKELLQQVNDLEKKVLDLEKERDWLKGIVAK